jgi:protein-tyrosine phosphatase
VRRLARGQALSVTRILFVCTGNICRSPTAEGVARAKAAARGLAEHFDFDSAGIEEFHVGDPPDRRAQKRAALRGYDLSALRARQVRHDDFKHFDLVLAMDRGHMRALERMCPAVYRDKLKLFLSFSGKFADRDVPDPYYGSDKDFDRVLDMCEEAVIKLLGG